MADLQHLIAALGKVADAYAPYAPDPNDDPDETNDPLDDPGDDDGDPLDDPKSYYPDEKDDQNENEESDFRRRKPLGMVLLLQRLEQQAQFKADQDRSLAARQHRIPPPLTKLEQKTAKLLQMRRQAAVAEHELKLNRQLEQESKRLQKANVELYKANKTDRERKELDADTRQMAIAFSTVCPEAHPDWRQHVAEAWRLKSGRYSELKD
jgi:hypothetical protein